MVRRVLLVVFLLVVGGCVSSEEIAKAQLAVNEDWRVRSEQIFDELGTRSFSVPIEVAQRAVRQALLSQGYNYVGYQFLFDMVDRRNMVLPDRNKYVGARVGFARAPELIREGEWEIIVAEDEERTRDVIRNAVGDFIASQFSLNPANYIVTLGVKMENNDHETTISLFGHALDLDDPDNALASRYIPPSALRIGLEKIWKEVEIEIAEQKNT